MASKTIKTKEIIKDIKTADRKKNLEYFEKKKDVNSKQKLNKGKIDSQQQTPKNYAVNKTVNTEKQTTIQAGIKSKALIDRKRKIKERKSIQSENQIKGKTIQKDIIKKKNKKDISLQSKETSPYPRIKTKSMHSNLGQNHSHDYTKKMKLHTIVKHKKKIKEAKETSSAIYKETSATGKVLKGIFGAVKKAVTGVNNIISIGTGTIVLIVIVLFIGVFSALSDDSSVDTSSMYVSREVLVYTETIEKYAKEYEIGEYVPFIQAVMMQESGGKGKEPMQSSECGFNEKYSKKHNGITNPDYSIKVDIQNLAECLKNAKATAPSDTPHISLALQSYNYGNGYIEWAVNHFGGYIRANAKVFSDEMKAKLQKKFMEILNIYPRYYVIII